LLILQHFYNIIGLENINFGILISLNWKGDIMNEKDREYALKNKRKGNGYIKLSEILDELNKTYHLEDSAINRDKLRKKVESVCKEIYIGNDQRNLWKKTLVLETEESKKPTHKFLPSEKQRLLDSVHLLEYLCQRSEKPELINAKKREILNNAEIAKSLNKREEDFLASVNMEDYQQELADYQNYSVSPEELRTKKMEIMLEALFLKFFTPINEELLKQDMEIINMGGGMDNTAETVGAAKRLKEGKSYYKEKNEDEEN